jgi:hypothetical protein
VGTTYHLPRPSSTSSRTSAPGHLDPVNQTHWPLATGHWRLAAIAESPWPWSAEQRGADIGHVLGVAPVPPVPYALPICMICHMQYARCELLGGVAVWQCRCRCQCQMTGAGHRPRVGTHRSSRGSRAPHRCSRAGTTPDQRQVTAIGHISRRMS